MRDWNTKYEELKRHQAAPKGKKARKMHDGREQLSVQLDDLVYGFLQERRNFGLAVSNVALIDEAKRDAAELNIVGFKASNGWLVRWKQHFNVGLRAKRMSLKPFRSIIKMTSDFTNKLSRCVRHMTGG